MVYRYVPILRWKRGERTALGRTSPAGRSDVVPLFVLGSDRYVGRDATKRRAAIPAAIVFAQEISRIWGGLPFYLDASAVPVPAGAPHHPLVDIAAHARAANLSLIPATTLSAPSNYQSAVAVLDSIDHRGVALRVDLQGLTSAASWAAAWPHPLADTDLVIDFADNVGNVNDLGPAINPAFTGMYAAGHWRTVTIVGSSMPENFTGFAAGLHRIPRAEWTLWQRLSAITGLKYMLHYGDYTTVAVVPPPGGIAWGYPINVKYTTQPEFLICRGVSTTGLGSIDMDQQLIGHAKSIVAYPPRNPLISCNGDMVIDDIAAETTGPGNLETWVTISVNRHVEIIRHLLP